MSTLSSSSSNCFAKKLFTAFAISLVLLSTACGNSGGSNDNEEDEPPVAGDDAATVGEGLSVIIDLTANDTAEVGDLDLTSVVIRTQPANGTVVDNDNGTVTYTHNDSETTADAFTYSIDDDSGNTSNTADVVLTITPQNDAPTAGDDASTIPRGSMVVINVALNDADSDGGLDLSSLVIVSPPTNGALVINGGGTFRYTHNGSMTTDDTFSYTIDDGFGASSNIANVQITIIDTIEDCRRLLFEEQLVVAADDCLSTVIANPTSPEATETALLLRSGTRLARLIDEQVNGPDPMRSTDSVKEIMDRLNITASGRSIFDFEADFDRTDEGKVVLPPNSPRGADLQGALAELVAPVIDASLADLRALSSDVIVTLAVGDLDLDDSVELDYGDVQAAIAVLESALVGLNVGLAIDVDLDIDSYTPVEDVIRIQDEVLNANANLLTATPSAADNYLAARDALRRSIDALIVSSNSILAETDSQEDDFLTISPKHVDVVFDLQADLSEIRQSTFGPTITGTRHPEVITAINGFLLTNFEPNKLGAGATLDLTQLFEADPPFSPRGFLPPIAFDEEDQENSFDRETIPDVTFGGILTGVALQCDDGGSIDPSEVCDETCDCGECEDENNCPLLEEECRASCEQIDDCFGDDIDRCIRNCMESAEFYEEVSCFEEFRDAILCQASRTACDFFECNDEFDELFFCEDDFDFSVAPSSTPIDWEVELLEMR